MYSKLPNLIFGFHGCDQSVFDEVIRNGKSLGKSSNTYDWLGHGIYFWEQSPRRAFDWAENNKKIKNPAVIGAIIDLGNCLNLADFKSTLILKSAYYLLSTECLLAEKPLPINRNVGSNSDLLLRDLDCAVIQRIHKFNEDENIPSFDSVRGIFIEGENVYKGSGFKEKTHIQLCVTNPNCIKGYFELRELDSKYTIP